MQCDLGISVASTAMQAFATCTALGTDSIKESRSYDELIEVHAFWTGHSRGARTGGLVLGVDVEDAVGVKIEGHRDLGHSTWRGRDAGQLKLAQQVVVARAAALALVDLHEQKERYRDYLVYHLDLSSFCGGKALSCKGGGL